MPDVKVRPQGFYTDSKSASKVDALSRASFVPEGKKGPTPICHTDSEPDKIEPFAVGGKAPSS
jgi:hypothetical protein